MLGYPTARIFDPGSEMSLSKVLWEIKCVAKQSSQQELVGQQRLRSILGRDGDMYM